MPIEILMPALSPTMTEGNLARWLKKEGDEVHAGDVIAEIETDKATMEYEAVDEGRIGRIIVPEGAQGIKVNAPIAVLLEEGEDEAALAGTVNAEGAAAPATRKEVAVEAGETGRQRDPSRTGKRTLRRAAMVRPASSPARWRGEWPCMPGSIWRGFAVPVRRAASSRRI
jgi:pyruvate/2-oxoglutarate dehydrogenase complex dihydrolipoamide acyltransferase (E2) component